jgi:hypothetical protein
MASAAAQRRTSIEVRGWANTRNRYRRLFFARSVHGHLNLASKPIKVLMQPIIQFSFGRVIG